MSRSFYEKILKLEKKRQELILELFSIEEIVQGSFCLIHVKCGNKHCRCNEGKLHPHYRMSMRRNGRQLSRAVPKQDHAWITKVTDNYRQFRRILKQISELENEGRKLLKQYEEGLVKKSSKRKAYLMIKETISEAKSENASENRVENRD